MRKVIDKKTALRAVILLFALIGILSVFPFRVWTTTIDTSAGGTIDDEIDPINIEYTVSQNFVVQYERLSSIDVYIKEVGLGRYLSATILNENQEKLLTTYVDTQGFAIPGYVRIPMEVNLEVGKEYALHLTGCRSRYIVAIEDVPDDSAYVGSLYRNGKEVPGQHLAAHYNYRMPLSKSLSVGIIAVIALMAAGLYAVVGLVFKKKPEWNTLLTTGTLIRYVANPVAVAFLGALMIMVFPLRMFDLRVRDIIFYEVGLLITLAFVLYAINHKAVTSSVGVSFWSSIRSEDRVRYTLVMFSIAMSIWYACCYMNDLYDIYHTLSERRMVIWLVITMLLTFSFKEAFTAYNLLWIVASGIYGIHYYSVNALADTEKEYDLHNLALKYGIIIIILGGLVLFSFIRRLFSGIRQPFTAYGFCVIIFLAAIVIMRNTRWWGVALAVTFISLYLRISIWGRAKDWNLILSGGLMFNFAISLGFCLLHRYFPGYVSGRFGFLFHTVTVTAEYFIVIGAAATVLLTAKIIAMPVKSGLKEIFKSAWKELAIFGWISAYTIFTVSRTAYLSLFVSVFTVLIVVTIRHRRQFFRLVAVMLLAALICFPAAFTLQRIIPAMIGQPVYYPIDDADPSIRGGADWDNPNFMCTERFINLFKGKVLGMDVSPYDYPVDTENYDLKGSGDPYYDNYGHPYEGSDEQLGNYGYADDCPENLLASSTITIAELRMLLDEMPAYVDYDNRWDVISNGRITIFRSYARELNMTGHDTMGAELPNGEIAMHAHNTYLQVAYDHGIPVGIMYIIFILGGIVFGIIYYIKNEKRDYLALMPFAALLGVMFAGLTEWVFQFSNPMTVVLMFTIIPLVIRNRNAD